MLAIRNKYGLYFWCIRFMAVVPYFVLVSVITAQQIRVSAVTSGQVPTEAELAARYLPEWRPAFYLTIAWGLALTSYEVFHMLFSTTYFRYVIGHLAVNRVVIALAFFSYSCFFSLQLFVQLHRFGGLSVSCDRMFPFLARQTRGYR